MGFHATEKETSRVQLRHEYGETIGEHSGRAGPSLARRAHRGHSSGPRTHSSSGSHAALDGVGSVDSRVRMGGAAGGVSGHRGLGGVHRRPVCGVFDSPRGGSRVVLPVLPVVPGVLCSSMRTVPTSVESTMETAAPDETGELGRPRKGTPGRHSPSGPLCPSRRGQTTGGAVGCVASPMDHSPRVHRA
jgi:hypothetical protein